MRYGLRYILCTLIGMAMNAHAFVLERWRLTGADSISIDVTVPTTVLNALVKAGVYPDPRVGMNNFMIPDASEPGNPWLEPWTYTTEFHAPAKWQGKKLWLKFDGINYRADVWVNGQQVADHDTMVGMFRRFKYDVTNLVTPGRRNEIAVKIYQVDHPGVPSPGTQFILFGPNRGNAGDIHRDETLKMSGGWDCAPVVRDRNMGIYLPVSIEATGVVTFDDPQVVTTLPQNDTTMAHVEVIVPLVNNGTTPVSGTLTAMINSHPEIDFLSYKKKVDNLIKPISLKRKVEIPAGDTLTVRLTPAEYRQLVISNPPLWYPNGYGEQPLQHLLLTFKPSKGAETVWECDFGMREIKTELMEREYDSHLGKDKEHGLVFVVNGRKVFSRGGWIQPDILLDNSERNIYDQVRLMAELGANTIGSEDMPTPDDAWLEACDKYGLLWWHVFHQCYRMFPGRANENNPDDHDLAVAHVKDEIKRYRNHPSVAIWVGVNEVCPSRDLYVATREVTRTLDPWRPYLPTTSISWDVEKLTPWLLEDMPTGTTDDGAPDYNWAPNDYYFDKINEVYTQMFKNELGMPAPPVYESLCKFIPTINKPFDERDRLWPLDSVWAEHGAWCVNNFVYRGFDNAVRTFYSDPTSAEDYVLKAQLVSADGYRAMIEAANHRAWDITTGVMLWKLNSCWPDVAWQVYDWYLTPNAAYYFTKKAMQPLHAQLNADSECPSIVNNSHCATGKLLLETQIHDFSMKKQWERTDTVQLAPYSYKQLHAIPKGQKLAAVYLVTLTLRDADGNEIERNTYWRYSQHQNFYWLLRLPQGEVKLDTQSVRDGDEWVIDVTLTCSPEGCAFFQHLTVSDTEDGPSVNPVFWSDNFITLLPGETRKVTARVAVDMLSGQPIIRIK